MQSAKDQSQTQIEKVRKDFTDEISKHKEGLAVALKTHSDAQNEHMTRDLVVASTKQVVADLDYFVKRQNDGLNRKLEDIDKSHKKQIETLEQSQNAIKQKVDDSINGIQSKIELAEYHLLASDRKIDYAEQRLEKLEPDFYNALFKLMAEQNEP